MEVYFQAILDFFYYFYFWCFAHSDCLFIGLWCSLQPQQIENDTQI